MVKTSYCLWLSRLFIGLVLIVNLQAALAFIAFPDRYAPGFGLSGPVGAGVVSGMGILFLMWTVPYFVAASNPIRRRISLFEAIAMQTIGLVGESLLLARLPAGFPQIEQAITRFIYFDGAGLVLLLMAAALTRTRLVTTQAGAA